MGIQAHIKVEDFAHAGAKVSLHRAYPDEDDFWDAEVYFPDGEELWFNSYPCKTQVWIDVNHWGNNRARYLPVLDKYNIPYTES